MSAGQSMALIGRSCENCRSIVEWMHRLPCCQIRLCSTCFQSNRPRCPNCLCAFSPKDVGKEHVGAYKCPMCGENGREDESWPCNLCERRLCSYCFLANHFCPTEPKVEISEAAAKQIMDTMGHVLLRHKFEAVADELWKREPTLAFQISEDALLQLCLSRFHQTKNKALGIPAPETTSLFHSPDSRPSPPPSGLQQTEFTPALETEFRKGEKNTAASVMEKEEESGLILVDSRTFGVHLLFPHRYLGEAKLTSRTCATAEKVLVAHGNNCFEIFRDGTGCWYRRLMVENIASCSQVAAPNCFVLVGNDDSYRWLRAKEDGSWETRDLVDMGGSKGGAFAIAHDDLFLIGGSNRRGRSTNVRRLQWENKFGAHPCNYPLTIGDAAAVFYKDAIVVAGGSGTFSGTKDRPKAQRGCYQLNFLPDKRTYGQWKPFPSLQIPRNNHGLFVFRNQLYAVGGQSGVPVPERSLDSASQTVEVFDEGRQSWALLDDASLAPLLKPVRFPAQPLHSL